jgi:pimeloyl-ACP methyl ester carboxylesterase
MFIDLDGIQINYKHVGSGDPLILLHGNSEDHSIFDPLTEKLKDYFSVYAIDSRNHGQSQKTEELKYELMAMDTYKFIKKLELQPAYVVGFSDGAIIALMTAMDHPGAFRKMVLMGPNTAPDDLNDEAVAFVKDLIEKHDSHLLRMILEEPHLDHGELAKIKVPSLLVFGEEDLFKADFPQTMAKTLGNTTLKIIAGHDHLSYVVNNDLLFPDIVTFFDQKIK